MAFFNDSPENSIIAGLQVWEPTVRRKSTLFHLIHTWDSGSGSPTSSVECISNWGFDQAFYLPYRIPAVPVRGMYLFKKKNTFGIDQADCQMRDICSRIDWWTGFGKWTVWRSDLQVQRQKMIPDLMLSVQTSKQRVHVRHTKKISVAAENWGKHLTLSPFLNVLTYRVLRKC